MKQSLIQHNFFIWHSGLAFSWGEQTYWVTPRHVLFFHLKFSFPKSSIPSHLRHWIIPGFPLAFLSQDFYFLACVNDLQIYTFTADQFPQFLIQLTICIPDLYWLHCCWPLLQMYHDHSSTTIVTFSSWLYNWVDFALLDSGSSCRCSVKSVGVSCKTSLSLCITPGN